MKHYDVVVVGSGFGGSVAALRLTEKGYSVGVMEAGRRFADDQLPETSWRLRRYLWAPWARCFGIMRITPLKDVLIASGTGVGGGSLVYANTLYEPLEGFYRDPQWSHLTDWREELAPHYDQAKRMLGVQTYTGRTTPDDLMATVAEGLGVGHTVHAADVGVLLGDERGKDVGDPYFGGVGPSRTTCNECGACMTGCRFNAKNMTVKNYLHLAEGAGATVHPLTTVHDVRPRTGGGYVVSTRRTGNRLRRRSFTADQVVFAGNALNTQDLLHRLRRSSLPGISERLGELSRTNSEAVLSARSARRDADMTPGLAITSSFHPDGSTHVEPVRYGRGSGALSLMNMALAAEGKGSQLRRVLRAYRRLGVRRALQLHDPRRWAEQTVVVLAMQSLDNSVTTFLRRGPLGLRMTSRQGKGEPNPARIPVADRVASDLAGLMDDGIPGGSIGELAGIPLTAHFIGGCVIGANPDEGVIDPYQRLFGHEGLHVADGSAISANLGVNPSLTITAQAEGAMSFWPNKGGVDARPPLGADYVPVDAVSPYRPVVPDHAPGALRLPDPALRPGAAPAPRTLDTVDG